MLIPYYFLWSNTKGASTLHTMNRDGLKMLSVPHTYISKIISEHLKYKKARTWNIAHKATCVRILWYVFVLCGALHHKISSTAQNPQLYAEHSASDLFCVSLKENDE